jgi:hypothetical protein
MTKPENIYKFYKKKSDYINLLPVLPSPFHTYSHCDDVLFALQGA